MHGTRHGILVRAEELRRLQSATRLLILQTPTPEVRSRLSSKVRLHFGRIRDNYLALPQLRVDRLLLAKLGYCPLPDFLIIGAQKAGTSSLYAHLCAQQGVHRAMRKEVRFFDQEYARGVTWYRAFFPPRGTTGTRLTGEATPNYFVHPMAPARVAETLPDVRLIAILRNPVERIVSNHRHEVTAGHISKKHHPFSAALNNNPAYIMQSRYTLHLKNWLEHFPSRQLKVFFFDDLRADPASFLHSLYEYLDVDPDFIPVGFSEPANVGRIPGNRGVDKSIASAGRFLRAIGLDGLIRLIRRTGIKDRVQQTNTNREISAIAEVSEQQQAELRELLREDILELSRLTERDLTGWTTPS